MVRKPERALQPAERMLAYLIAAPRDSASAGAAQATIQAQGGRSDWKFGADGAPIPVSEKEAAMESIIRSVLASGEPGDDLLSYLHETHRSGFQRMVIFAPPRSGVWIDRVIEASAQLEVQVLLCLDGVQNTSAFASWMHLILQPQASLPPAVVDKKELDDCLERLYTSNVDVYIADRCSGGVISALQFQRMAS